jgi:hypothetical protein
MEPPTDSIKSEWEYFSRVIPADTSAKERAALQRIFYVGAASVLDLLQRRGDARLLEVEAKAFLWEMVR